VIGLLIKHPSCFILQIKTPSEDDGAATVLVKSNAELRECLLQNNEFSLGITSIFINGHRHPLNEKQMGLLSNALKRASCQLSSLTIKGQNQTITGVRVSKRRSFLMERKRCINHGSLTF